MVNTCQLLLLLLVLFSKSYASSLSFAGSWCWEDLDKSNSLFLKFKKIGDQYWGGYWYILDGGGKFDDNEDAFNFKDHHLSTVQVKVIGGEYSAGLVQMKLLNDKQMEWLIIKSPEGVFYPPRHVFLTRCNSKDK